ncbi:aquaporin, partial [Pseudomonas aeruginosa]
PILGACLGAGGYRVLIARHLPSAAAPAEAEPEKVRAS